MGHTNTFAEMSIDEKSSMSHRGIAVQKMVSFLNSLKS
jgi:XTP/dITP diphosphohydrolase